MFEFVVGGHFLVVNGERARLNATFIFLGGMGTKLPGEHVQDSLTHPSAFGERGECEVVRIDFSET